MLLEIAETVPLLPPVGELGVQEERNPPTRTRTDRLGDERIRRGFVPVPSHGHDMHQSGLSLIFVAHQLGETNQALPEERADENAPVEECGAHPADRLQIFPAVRKRDALSHRGLVVEFEDPLDEGVVERHLAG